jgi:hypothetical protein
MADRPDDDVGLGEPFVEPCLVGVIDRVGVQRDVWDLCVAEPLPTFVAPAHDFLQRALEEIGLIGEHELLELSVPRTVACLQKRSRWVREQLQVEARLEHRPGRGEPVAFQLRAQRAEQLSERLEANWGVDADDRCGRVRSGVYRGERPRLARGANPPGGRQRLRRTRRLRAPVAQPRPRRQDGDRRPLDHRATAPSARARFTKLAIHRLLALPARTYQGRNFARLLGGICGWAHGSRHKTIRPFALIRCHLPTPRHPHIRGATVFALVDPDPAFVH